MIEGDPSNQVVIAERGGIPPILKIMSETHHPSSVREAAAQALALLAYEPCGGPAQEILTEIGGVGKLVSCYREEGCTEQLKQACEMALRYMVVYKPAKLEMKALGVTPTNDASQAMAGLDVVPAAA